jgi:hypothetical protein
MKPPGTRYFKLEKLENKDVFKFMSSVLANMNSTETFGCAGSDHCNHTGPLGTYRLVEMTLEELTADLGRGKKRKVTRKNIKVKQATKKRANAKKPKATKRREIKPKLKTRKPKITKKRHPKK